jgi:hypothetical protein
MEDKKKFNLSGFIRACQDAYPDKRMFLAYISKRWDDVAEERLRGFEAKLEEIKQNAGKG